MAPFCRSRSTRGHAWGSGKPGDGDGEKENRQRETTPLRASPVVTQRLQVSREAARRTSYKQLIFVAVCGKACCDAGAPGGIGMGSPQSNREWPG